MTRLLRAHPVIEPEIRDQDEASAAADQRLAVERILARVREAMARHGASHHFVSTVDDLCWITNLRGNRNHRDASFVDLVHEAFGNDRVKR